MYAKTILALLAIFAIQQNHGAAITNNYLFNSSFPGLYNQVKVLMTNVQTLVVNHTLQNAMNNLKLAKSSILYIQSKASTASVRGLLNNTLSSITGSLRQVQNRATGTGVDTSSCTKNTFSRLLNIGIDGAARVAACPVDEGTKAIIMINNDIAYVSKLTNITLYAPQAINNCINVGNITTVARAKCVSTYLGSTAYEIINAPAKVTSMVNDAYAYVSIFPTNIAVCATNSSLAAIGNAATLALDTSMCITATVLSS